MAPLLVDSRWMGAALSLAERGRGRATPNPNVGCVIVREGRVVGRGWTQPGGRPHAEAMALAEAGEAARGATAYTTLEPCAHVSPRGPACADLLAEAGVARVVTALRDPDPRIDGAGFARLREAGINVETGVEEAAARRSLALFLTRQAFGRPFVTLKLATSLDGAIATGSGGSRWITGEAARAHAHLERARHDAILVGGGTWEQDSPQLDVRLPGLEDRAPRRVVLSSRPHPSAAAPLPPSPDGRGRGAEGGGKGEDSLIWLRQPTDIATLVGIDSLLVEGGMATAAAFLAADLVDRLLLYRASILIGGGRTLPDIGLTGLAAAHGHWRLDDARTLGSDRLEVYERAREPN